MSAPPPSRAVHRLLVAVLALVASVGSACAGSTAGSGSASAPTSASVPASSSAPDSAGVAAADARTVVLPQMAASPREQVPPALVASDHIDIPSSVRDADPAFGPSKVRATDLVAGGPAPDGIPSIDNPRFLRVDDVAFLTDREPVFVLELGDDVRAYPLQILLWHEIVNDTVGGIPVAVTYCPLCNSAFAHDRRHEGRVLAFGVSGFLWNSALVMFDRQTWSLWSHFTGEGLLGTFGGAQLRSYPVTLASWAEFRAANPAGLVLSRETGFDKDYGRNPYPGYDDVDDPPFLFEGRVDGRYAAKTRLVGLDLPAGPQGVTLDRLRRDRVVRLADGERELVVWWQAGTSSALDDRIVGVGADVGTTRAFEATVDGRSLQFEPATTAPGGFRDVETGSEWNVFGRATAGPLAGRQLTPVVHVDTFWFAWAAFRPDTTILG